MRIMQRPACQAARAPVIRPAAGPRRPRRACACVAIGRVGVDEARKLVREADWAYLDVRTEEEFEEGSVEGSVNVPVFVRARSGAMELNDNFVRAVTEAFPEPGTPLVVGCRSGQRSLSAIELLANQGYDNMVNLDGGILAWQAAEA